MHRRRLVVAVVLFVVLAGVGGTAWWVRSRPAGTGKRSRAVVPAQRPRLAEAGPRDPTDPFPLDDRIRVFDTGRAGEGVLMFERVATHREKLSDAAAYTVVETRARTRATGARRVVCREWLRRTPEGVFCGRREEGPLGCDLVPPQPVLLLPLEVGRRWTWTGLAGGRPSRLESAVAACERVTVGLGTFHDAWRIDTEVRTDDEQTNIRRSLWLQPGIGLVEERATLVVEGRTVQLDATLRELTD